MGIGSVIVGIIVGAGGILLIQKAQAEEIEIPIIPDPIVLPQPEEDSISVNVNPNQIDSDRFQFEVDYFNRSPFALRAEAVFEVVDSDNRSVSKQTKTLDFESGSTTQIFWDTGELTTQSAQVGDFIAIFTTVQRNTTNPLSRPEVVIFPVSLPGTP